MDLGLDVLTSPAALTITYWLSNNRGVKASLSLSLWHFDQKSYPTMETFLMKLSSKWANSQEKSPFQQSGISQ